MVIIKQNKAWASLDESSRRMCREIYRISSRESDLLFLIESLYGRSNLSSPDEPKEIAVALKASVRRMFAQTEQILRLNPRHTGALLLKACLRKLFGDDCLPERMITGTCCPVGHRGPIGQQVISPRTVDRPARLRNHSYWFFDNCLNVVEMVDRESNQNNDHHKAGNYFLSREQALQAAREIRKCLNHLHRQIHNGYLTNKPN